MRRGALLLVTTLALAVTSRDARADAPPSDPTVAAERSLLEGDLKDAPLRADDAVVTAPPPRPYQKSVVLDTAVGAFGFAGEMGKVAPPGFWLHTQVGYEVFRWLMVLGEGDLGFTDTSNEQAPPQTRAFPIFGGGGGLRFTARFGERLGLYLQGTAGGMKADIRVNALRNIGFGDAESLGLYYGGRLGVELYQVDRHLALGLTGGTKLAQGFTRTRGSDTPLVIDGGLALRYAF